MVDPGRVDGSCHPTDNRCRTPGRVLPRTLNLQGAWGRSGSGRMPQRSEEWRTTLPCGRQRIILQLPPGTDRNDASFSIGADVYYELDLFGRVGSGITAARGDLAAARADADAVRVMVVANTTAAYADAASAAARAEVAQSIVELLDQSLRLTRKRHNAGLEDGLAVARIETLRDQRAATIPAIEAQRSAALFALATLTGRTPSQLPAITGVRRVPLEIDTPLPVGDGAQLLARRPDVRAAEQRLRAYTARIGVAEADLYPRISLGGSISSQANSIGNLFTGGPLGFFVSVRSKPLSAMASFGMRVAAPE